MFGTQSKGTRQLQLSLNRDKKQEGAPEPLSPFNVQCQMLNTPKQRNGSGPWPFFLPSDLLLYFCTPRSFLLFGSCFLGRLAKQMRC